MPSVTDIFEGVASGDIAVADEVRPKSVTSVFSDIWYGDHTAKPEAGLSEEERQQIISTIEPHGFLEQTAENTSVGAIGRGLNRAYLESQGIPYEEVPNEPMGMGARIASQGISLIADPLTHGAGAIGGAAATELLGKKLIGETVKRGMIRGSIEGSTMMGTMTAIHDPLEQYARKGEVDLAETAKATGKSAILGASLGPLGKDAIGYASAPAEVAAFTVGGAAFEGRLPTTEDFITNAGLILGVKGVAKVRELAKKLRERGPEDDPKKIADEVLGEETTDKVLETLKPKDQSVGLSVGGQYTMTDAEAKSLGGLAKLADKEGDISRKEYSDATGIDIKKAGLTTQAERRAAAIAAKDKLGSAIEDDASGSFFHFSNKSGLTELDPSKFGSNPVTSKSEVQNAGADRSAAFGEGGEPEHFFGPGSKNEIPYVVVDDAGKPITGKDLYDFGVDPDGLLKKMSFRDAEAKIKEDGKYLGYWFSKHPNSSFNGQARFVQPVKVKELTPEAIATRSMAFVSGNTDTGLTDAEIQKRLDSPQMQKREEMLRKLALSVTPNVRVEKGSGHWADGAEDTFVVDLPGYRETDTADYIGSKAGRILAQKAVLTFHYGVKGGSDYVYEAELPENVTRSDAAAVLQAHGIDYKTITHDPDTGALKMRVVDFGGENSFDAFKTAGNQLGAKHATSRRGKARLIEAEGNDARTDQGAREASARVFADIESGYANKRVQRTGNTDNGLADAQGEEGQKAPTVGMAAAMGADGAPSADRAPAAPDEAVPATTAAAKAVSASGSTGVKGGRLAKFAEKLADRAISFRQYLGEKNREVSSAKAALDEAVVALDKYPDEKLRQFHADYETGNHSALPKPVLEIAKTITKMLRAYYKKAIEAWGGTVDEANLIDNFLARIYENKPTELEAARKLLGGQKNPLRGSGQHLKERTLDDVVKALEQHGLKLADHNFARLAIVKIESLVAAQKAGEMKQRDGVFVYGLGRAPDGYAATKGTLNMGPGGDPTYRVHGPGEVTVQEAYDLDQRAKLLGFLSGIGVNVKRTWNIRSRGGIEPWGHYDIDTDTVRTKFGGPNSVLMHETGHALNERYDLFSALGGDPSRPSKHNAVIGKEWTDLAKERLPKNPTPEQKKYVFHPDEKAAALVEAYLHAPELLRQKAPTLAKAFDDLIAKTPELHPLTEIKPGLKLGTDSTTRKAPGANILGYWAFPEKLAAAIDNYQSKGFGKNPLLRGTRMYNNVANSINLLGYAHLGGNALREFGNGLAASLAELSSGRVGEAGKKLVGAFIDPIRTPIKGAKLRAEYLRKTAFNGDPIAMRAAELANAQPLSDKWWHLSSTGRMAKDVRDMRFAETKNAKIVAAAKLGWHTPLAVLDAVMRPVRAYTELAKFGRFGEMVHQEIARRGGLAGGESELAEISKKAWDAVEARMGLVTYDNVNIPKALKDIGFVSLRAPGWSAGTLYWLGSSVRDIAEIRSRIEAGKPWMTERMAYLVGSLLATSIAGATAQYLWTGKPPEDITDLLYPRNGDTNPDGSESRTRFLTDIPDILSYAHHPIATVGHKLSPAIGNMYETFITNQNYYGDQIRNPNDSAYTQFMQVAADQLNKLLPFSVQSGRRNEAAGDSIVSSYLKPTVGILNAPMNVQRSPALQQAMDYVHQQMPSRTPEQVEASRKRHDLAQEEKQNPGTLLEAVKSGEITSTQRRNMMRNMKQAPLEIWSKFLSPHQAMDVWEKATPEERNGIKVMLVKKIRNALHEKPKSERDAIRQRAKSLGLIQ
ncbi:hypothetical protein [Nitrospira sp. BLG_1]|uniref:hypothetical protein n=1 Tax=Nitrospira sp. BLG_1 TaxID=3395883 RepID=UPI0039BCF41E